MEGKGRREKELEGRRNGYHLLTMCSRHKRRVGADLVGSFSLKSSPVGQSLSLSSRGSFVVGSLSLTGKEVKEAGGRRKSEGKKEGKRLWDWKTK